MLHLVGNTSKGMDKMCCFCIVKYYFLWDILL